MSNAALNDPCESMHTVIGLDTIAPLKYFPSSNLRFRTHDEKPGNAFSDVIAAMITIIVLEFQALHDTSIRSLPLLWSTLWSAEKVGTHQIVLDNRFSRMTPRAVQVDATLTYLQ